jgi:ligand-binding sensor domain-containing protein
MPIYSFVKSNDGNKLYEILRDSKGRYWLGGDNGLILTNSITSTHSGV